jgi:hypothetical protein
VNDVIHLFNSVTPANQKMLIFTQQVIKIKVMRSLLYIVAVIFVIGWGIGFIGYQAGGAIHLLLVIAVVAVLINIIQGEKAL